MASKTKGGKSSEQEKMDSLDEQELESLYAWVDSIPLSRPKRNISRDFSDGVCVAEVIKHFFPNDGLVDLHNYTMANNTQKKKENWYLLNRKVFSKMNFELAEEVIEDLVGCKPGMIEKVLLMLQVKIRRAEYGRTHQQSDKPEADQHQMTPGRKDSKLNRVTMDDTKGGRFAKAKQLQEQKPAQKKLQKPAVIPKRRPGPVVESDVVPRYVIEEKEQEILSRDETIQILQAKISRLEHLLHLKDMRIDDLQNRVESMRPTGIKK